MRNDNVSIPDSVTPYNSAYTVVAPNHEAAEAFRDTLTEQILTAQLPDAVFSRERDVIRFKPGAQGLAIRESLAAAVAGHLEIELGGNPDLQGLRDSYVGPPIDPYVVELQ